MRVTRSRGFTLIETLVAVALTGALLAAMVSLSFGFLRTFYIAQGLQRLQRELVLSTERIYHILKVATGIEEETEGLPAPTDRIYYVQGLEYDVQAGAPVPSPDSAIRLTGTTLTVNGMKSSTNVAYLNIDKSPSNETEVRRLTITTVDRFGLIPSNRLPLSISIEVKLRNYHLDPNLEEPPEVLVVDPGNSVTISWRTTCLTWGEVWYGTDPNELVSIQSSGMDGLEHTVTIDSLEWETTYFFRIRGVASDGSEHEFLSNRIYAFGTDEFLDEGESGG